MFVLYCRCVCVCVCAHNLWICLSSFCHGSCLEIDQDAESLKPKSVDVEEEAAPSVACSFHTTILCIRRLAFAPRHIGGLEEPGDRAACEDMFKALLQMCVVNGHGCLCIPDL